jgi:hypothetical protein
MIAAIAAGFAVEWLGTVGRVFRDCCFWSVIALIAAPTVAAASDAEFKSEKGFTVKYPSDWKIASAQESATMQQEAQSVMKKLGISDLSQFAVIILDPASGRSPASMNVTITHGRVPLDDSGMVSTKMRENARQVAGALGAQMSDFSGGVETIGENKAAVSRYRLSVPGLALRQTQMCVPAGGQTFVFTCTAPENQRAKYDAIFQSMMSSVKVESNFFSSLPPWALYGIVGGVIGGVIALISGISKRNKKTAPGTSAY